MTGVQTYLLQCNSPEHCQYTIETPSRQKKQRGDTFGHPELCPLNIYCFIFNS